MSDQLREAAREFAEMREQGGYDSIVNLLAEFAELVIEQVGLEIEAQIRKSPSCLIISETAIAERLLAELKDRKQAFPEVFEKGAGK